jgi:CheY-like chemotaxis protein
MHSAIACVEDLMFLSRIRTAAGGADVTVALRPDALIEACRSAARPLVVVDLDSARLDALGVVRALRAEPDLGNVTIVGFVSHVHADRGRAAREAGVTQVLARSAFVRELPRILSGQVPGTIGGGGEQWQ